MNQDQGSIQRRKINPWTWQDQFGFSQALEVTGGRRILYCAGQASMDPDGNPAHEGDMQAQLGQALDNLMEVLGESGFSLGDVVRLNAYMTDVDAFLAAYGTLEARLSEAGCRPSSTLLGVQRLAFPSLMVELEATAVAD